MKDNLLSTACKPNSSNMVVSKRVEIGSVDDFVGKRIRQIWTVLCQSNCSFIDGICRIVDEVECFFRGLFCLRFCHFWTVEEGMRGCGVKGVVANSRIAELKKGERSK